MPMERALRNDQDLDQDRRRSAEPELEAAVPDLGAVVQRKEDTANRVALTGEADVQAAAQAGVQGGGAPLPHLDQIQASFGEAHDLSGIRAHVGGPAGAASQEIGAEGYATGSDVAFEQQPDLHLAAHEAAHVVQQRQGVQMKGGVGQAGDAYEQHADAVADRVVAGRSAADLLPASTAGGGDAAVQLYNETEIRGEHWRVSESGKSMLKQADALQDLYATDDLIAAANAALKNAGAKGSFIKLTKGASSLKVGENMLHRVEPEMQPTGDDAANDKLEEMNEPDAEDSAGVKGDTMALWADCGRSSRAVMGTDGAGQAPRGYYQDGGKTATTSRTTNPATYSDEIYLATIPDFLKLASSAKYLKDGVHYSGDKSSPKTPASADEARTMYWELGEDGRREFDKFAGINSAANPDIGGAYTMNTEYRMPGSGVVPGKKRWNFHWGGVVMKDGSNNVTLENYAVGFPKTGDEAKDAENRKIAYSWVNRDWNFQIYGTAKKGQSFHEEHLDTGTHGTRASTFAAKVD